MPELPEVETIVRSLRNPVQFPISSNTILGTRPGIVGRVISDTVVLWNRSIQEPDAQSFKQRLSGQAVKSVDRRGKFLVISLTNEWLLIHLRMSGDIRVEEQDEKNIKPHDRVIINFKDQTRLVFNDTRKFGRIWLVDDPARLFCNLGPELLSDDFNSRQFHELLKIRKRKIKPLLMDQQFIAGLGNIYTDESLHKAGIHPMAGSDTISFERAERLLESIRDVLNEGIRRNGASIDWVYRGGDFQNYFQVYQRDGEPCYTCGTKIERIIVGQRGTHFCPHCQPYPE